MVNTHGSVSDTKEVSPGTGSLPAPLSRDDM